MHVFFPILAIVYVVVVLAMIAGIVYAVGYLFRKGWNRAGPDNGPRRSRSRTSPTCINPAFNVPRSVDFTRCMASYHRPRPIHTHRPVEKPYCPWSSAALPVRVWRQPERL
jgi:hypothetical protein